MVSKFKKIVIASDHGGYIRKNEIYNYLIDKYKDTFICIDDIGTYSEESVDYPDFAHKLAKGVDTNKYDVGILLCGSGNGVSMVANKYANVRAGLSWNKEISELARLHNNANVLTIPGRYVSKEEAIEIVEIFLNTEFEGGRHEKRVNKIAK